jgi:serine/threonine protein kinase
VYQYDCEAAHILTNPDGAMQLKPGSIIPMHSFKQLNQYASLDELVAEFQEWHCSKQLQLAQDSVQKKVTYYYVEKHIGAGGQGCAVQLLPLTYAHFHNKNAEPGELWLKYTGDPPVIAKLQLASGMETDEALEDFQREVLLSSRLQHPNIVQVHDVGLVGLRRVKKGPLVPATCLLMEKGRSQQRFMSEVRGLTLFYYSGFLLSNHNNRGSDAGFFCSSSSSSSSTSSTGVSVFFCFRFVAGAGHLFLHLAAAL